LRIKEFLLAQQVIHESHRWLGLATDPRRHQLSLTQICRLTEMAFKLSCLAIGKPFDQKPRRPRKEDRPGYWTGPSVEEALEKIYGSKSDAASDGGGASVPASSAENVGNPPSIPAGGIGGPPVAPVSPPAAGGASMPESHSEGVSNPASLPASGPGGSPQGPPPRCDAWSRSARTMRRMRSST
jgi:hypothetical protein